MNFLEKVTNFQRLFYIKEEYQLSAAQWHIVNTARCRRSEWHSWRMRLFGVCPTAATVPGKFISTEKVLEVVQCPGESEISREGGGSLEFLLPSEVRIMMKPTGKRQMARTAYGAGESHIMSSGETPAATIAHSGTGHVPSPAASQSVLTGLILTCPTKIIVRQQRCQSPFLECMNLPLRSQANVNRICRTETNPVTWSHASWTEEWRPHSWAWSSSLALSKHHLPHQLSLFISTQVNCGLVERTQLYSTHFPHL